MSGHRKKPAPPGQAAPAVGKPGTGEIPEVKVIDKRFWARGEPAEGAPSADLDLKPSYVQELEQKMALMEQRFQEKAAEFQAESRCIHERLAREMERRLEEEKSRLVLDLLEVLDNLENALEAIRRQATLEQLQEGILLVRDSFLRKMERLGLQPLGAAGEPFDPRWHEAVEVRATASPEEDGKVVAVWQRGFATPDRLVRPARVSVGRCAEAAHGAAAAEALEAPVDSELS